MKNDTKRGPRYFILAGVALAALYWMIEAAVHVFILHKGSFAQYLFAPGAHDLWMRSSVAILVISFGLYAHVATTKRTQAEEELRESEEKYRALIETTDTAFVIIDGDGNVLDANSEYVRMTGHQTLDEILGRCVVEWTAEYDQERNAQAVRKCFQLGFTRNLEIDYVRKDGKTTPTEINATVIETKDGPIVVTLCRDITARKHSEHALQQSETKYRTLVETLPQNVFSKDIDLVYVACNESYARDLGITPDEIAGHTDYDFFPTELAEKYRADDKKVIESGQTGELEETYIRDGEEIIVHTVKTPIKDDNGNTLGILGIFWDITERKRAEDALQEAHRRNDAILSTSMDGFYTTHPDGNIFDCNAAFCEMVGYSRDELLGMKITALETVECCEETAQHIQQVIEKGSARFETAHRHKDGTIVDLEVSVTFVELLDEKFCVCFARDITETKMLLEELNHQLVRDTLTGVYNRRYFNETIIQEIKRADRYGHHVSFIMGDIDGLKAVNDNCGHLAGDQILQGTAQVLEQTSRAADVVIRYGGDEFLVVMPETRTEQAHVAVERFEQAFSEWLDQRAKEGALPSDLPADLGFSMGVACYEPGLDVAVEEVILRADQAMYLAKQDKRAKRATA